MWSWGWFLSCAKLALGPKPSSLHHGIPLPDTDLVGDTEQWVEQ